ncbi:MAG: signal peptidase II [Gaiellaceae bacterium]
MSDGARQLDVRVGSTPDGLAPISVAERALGATPWQWAGLGLIVLVAVTADQLTKWLVRGRIGLYEQVHVVGPLWFRHVRNTGIAFGLFSSATPIVIVITTLIVIWLLFFFARAGSRHPILPAALGLVIGGSLSNLVDRVRIGHVTDFVNIGSFPAFNLADSFITLGVIVLATAVLMPERPAVLRLGSHRDPRP